MDGHSTKRTVIAPLAIAVAMTAVVAGLVFAYPSVYTGLLTRMDENGARRAATLAAAGDLAGAERALDRACARRVVWLDASTGEERQRVYLGKHIAVDHRDFIDASRAFLDDDAADLALRAAWQAVWRVHAVNRAGESADVWQALANAAITVGDDDVANEAARIARAWSEQTDPLWPADETQSVALTDGALIDPGAFRVSNDGWFKPENAFVATSDSLAFDRPCVAIADLPTRDGATVVTFEARGQRAYDWPPIVVASIGDEARLRVVASAEWATIRFEFPAGDALTLRLAYLNHGAEETKTGVRRRSLEVRNVRVR